MYTWNDDGESLNPSFERLFASYSDWQGPTSTSYPRSISASGTVTPGSSRGSRAQTASAPHMSNVPARVPWNVCFWNRTHVNRTSSLRVQFTC